MSRVRIGALRTAAVLAAVALAGAGCDSINEAKDSVDSATNTVEVCADATTLTVDKLNKVTQATKLAEDPAKQAEFQQAIKTEFTALHDGLQKQIDKAKEADLKSALQALDDAVASWAANPEKYVTEAAKLTDLAGAVDKACGKG